MTSKTIWRANMAIGFGTPGHYEINVVYSDWYDTKEEAEQAAKDLYDNEPFREHELYRRIFIEKKVEEKKEKLS